MVHVRLKVYKNKRTECATINIPKALSSNFEEHDILDGELTSERLDVKIKRNGGKQNANSSRK